MRLFIAILIWCGFVAANALFVGWVVTPMTSDGFSMAWAIASGLLVGFLAQIPARAYYEKTGHKHA